MTDFERAVYAATATIRPGEVRSYGWVARKIGRPRASRAVGNTLHKNPFLGIVPCHRVIKANGTIGGFARGGAVKARMLAREGCIPAKKKRNSFFSFDSSHR